MELEDRTGSLTSSLEADLVVLDAPDSVMALRTIAPRLRGSLTPSSATISLPVRRWV